MKKRKLVKTYTYGGISVLLIFVILSLFYIKRLEKNVISVYIDSIKFHSNFLSSSFSSIYPSEKTLSFMNNFIISENLVYIAILDSSNKVKVWASAFENFLPLNVKGKYIDKNIKIINTRLGNILEIRGTFRDKKGKRMYFVAGYPYFLIEERIVKESFSRTFLLLLITGIIFSAGLWILGLIQKEVEEKERKISEKEEFIQIATELAHEIKNPLNIIAMGLQSIEQEEGEKKRKFFLLRK